MVCIALHKLFISENDPSQPRWQLEVNELDFIREFSFVRRLKTRPLVLDGFGKLHIVMY